jgi:hypothetical protein
VGITGGPAPLRSCRHTRREAFYNAYRTHAMLWCPECGAVKAEWAKRWRYPEASRWYVPASNKPRKPVPLKLDDPPPAPAPKERP